MATLGGVAKKISLFECPNENRLKRKSAIKRKKTKSREDLNRSLESVISRTPTPTAIATFISRVSLSIPPPQTKPSKVSLTVNKCNSNSIFYDHFEESSENWRMESSNNCSTTTDDVDDNVIEFSKNGI